MFSIKQVAEDLGITQQAIYKQKNVLVDKGYIIKNNSDKYELTGKGYQYLKEKRVNKIKRKAEKLINDNSKSSEKSMISETIDLIWLNEKLTNMYEERIRELQGQVIYFKKLFEDEKNDKIKIQSYILKKFESL